MGETSRRHIIPFLKDGLSKNTYREVLKWVDESQLIFRIIHMSSRNNFWKKHMQLMSQLYVDWAKIKDKLDSKKTLRDLKKVIEEAIKSRVRVKKLKKLKSPNKHWKCYQILVDPEKTAVLSQKSIKRKQQKNKTKKVMTIFKKESSALSNNSIQNDEVAVSKPLPSCQTLLPKNLTPSSFQLEQTELFHNMDEQFYIIQQEFDEILSSVHSSPCLTSALSDFENESDINWDLSYESEHLSLAIEAQAISPAQTFFELESSVVELETSLYELGPSLLEQESSLFELEPSLFELEPSLVELEASMILSKQKEKLFHVESDSGKVKSDNQVNMKITFMEEE